MNDAKIRLSLSLSFNCPGWPFNTKTCVLYALTMQLILTYGLLISDKTDSFGNSH